MENVKHQKLYTNNQTFKYVYNKTTVSNKNVSKMHQIFNMTSLLQTDLTFLYQTHIKLILNISHIYQHITQ